MTTVAARCRRRHRQVIIVVVLAATSLMTAFHPEFSRYLRRILWSSSSSDLTTYQKKFQSSTGNNSAHVSSVIEVETGERGANSSLAVLSRQTNGIQRQLLQLMCNKDSMVLSTETGGWCNTALNTEHRTDTELAKALSVLLFDKSVVGLGDGLGEYRQIILNTGLVERYDSYDGAPFIEEMTEGKVQFLDLAIPQFWLPVYDWVVCLEVLEHIPPEYEQTALENIVKVARSGIVLSWARPGQGGLGHVNPRPERYIEDQMERRGLTLDIESSNRLRDKSTFAWFKFNVNVFRRTNESIRSFRLREEDNGALRTV